MKYVHQLLGLRSQQTIKNTMQSQGVGIHSGKISQLTFHAAPVNAGVEFHVMNEDQCIAVIPATIEYLLDKNTLRTVLTNHGFRVETVEHLLAALRAHNIDNVYIKIWGQEIPIHDGSAANWSQLIEHAGIQEQPFPIRAIKIIKPMKVTENDSWASLSPGPDSSFRYDMEYDHPLIGNQSFEFKLSQCEFQKQISSARTFGFLKDLDTLKLHKLAQGASLLNTLVFDDVKVLNQQALLWHNEPARHKVCDAIGDLSLAGYPIVGMFHGYKSGHALNQKLVVKLLSHTNHWCFTSVV